MNNNFVTKDFENYIEYNVINNVYPKLNYNDKNYLLTLLIEIINFISIHYNFISNDRSTYLHQFKQNNKLNHILKTHVHTIH